MPEEQSMRKYILFASATLVMVGAVFTFRNRLIDRQGQRPARQTEERISLRDRMGKAADEVLDKMMDSSELVEQTITIGDVNELVIEGTASVRIRQGEKNSLTIRSPSFSKDAMKHRMEGKKLILNGISIPSFIGTLQSEYELTLASVKEVNLRGTGNLDGLTPFKLEKIQINNAGSGNVRMSIDSEELGVTIAGSGNISIEGRAEALNAKILGSGNISARAFNGGEATVRILGSGDADLGFFKVVDANILGSGNISCVEGAKLDVNSLGSGTLRQVPPPAAEPAAIPAPVESPAEIPAP
jgi:hypothetical protein